jgi:hypothetical protein
MGEVRERVMGNSFFHPPLNPLPSREGILSTFSSALLAQVLHCRYCFPDALEEIRRKNIMQGGARGDFSIMTAYP